MPDSLLKITLLFLTVLLTASRSFAQTQKESSLKDLLTKAEIYEAEEKLDSALFYYNQALSLAKKEEDKSFIFYQIGYVNLLLEKYAKAELHIKKALNNALTITPGDTLFISELYYYIAYCLIEMEDLDQALVYNKKSLSIFPKEADPIGYAETLSAIASIYFQKSDYDSAILYEQKVLNIIGASQDKLTMAFSKNGLALCYYYKQEYAKALSFSQSSINIFESILADSVAADCISAYNNQALILIKLEDIKKAKNYLQLAKKLHEKYAVSQGFEITLFNEAFLNYKLHEKEKAILGFEKTIALYQQKYQKGHSNIGKAYYYLAKISEEEGNIKPALKYCQISLKSFTPDFNNNNISNNPDLKNYCRSHRNLLKTLIVKAKLLGVEYLQTELKNSHLENAVFQTYDLAIETVDLLRQSYKAEGSQYFLAEESKDLFEQALDLSFQLYKKTNSNQYLQKAFFYIEKNRKPILLQNHLAIEGQKIGGVPIEILDQERQLAIDYGFYKNNLALAETSKDSDKIQRFRNYTFKYKQQLDSLRQQIKIHFPRHFEYQYVKNTISINQVQKQLKNRQLFLNYYITDKQVYAFVISPNSAELILIKNKKQIKDATSKLLASIQNPIHLAFSEQKSYETFTSSAFFLFTQLIQPILDHQKETPNRLIITTNGFLTEIPFETLLTNKTNSKQINYLGLSYLIKKYVINYQPSASLMVRLQQQQQNNAPKSEILAIAPFAEVDAQIANSNIRSALGNLPFSKQEVKNLAQSFPTTILYQNKAKKKSFLELAAKYQVLHMATHGVADFGHKDNAHLFFHPDNSANPIDHIIYNYEIENLHLNTDLVVLSACETGAGRIDTGEGILSLARSFFYTGASSLIMSKWKINDQATSLIIDALYKELSIKTPKDQALQKAKIIYLKTEADPITAHPFYWAGLVQIGNTKPLNFNKKNYSKSKILSLCLFLVLLIFMIHRFYFTKNKNFNL